MYNFLPKPDPNPHPNPKTDPNPNQTLAKSVNHAGHFATCADSQIAHKIYIHITVY